MGVVNDGELVVVGDVDADVNIIIVVVIVVSCVWGYIFGAYEMQI